MNPILECKNLEKYYGNHPALKGINLELEKGKIVGLLGPNGSGKTTLIKLASGLLLPNKGEILINGLRPCEETKKHVAYLPERNYFNNQMTVEAMVHFMADFYEDFKVERAYKLLGDLAIDPERKFKELSKGTKEKVQLILVMSRDAELYLLDEPIGGVDPAAREYILNTIINNYNKTSTVLISTHMISDVEPILSEFIFIKNGDLIRHDTVKSVTDEGKTIDELFREEFRC